MHYQIYRFGLPSDPDQIEYTRFCRTIDEASIPPCLTKPSLDDVIKMSRTTGKRALPIHQWANFKERKMLEKAMNKLYKYMGLENTNLFKVNIIEL